MISSLTYFKNISWVYPEIFLTFAIIALFTYGVAYSKLGGKITQQKKITWLSIFSLIITFYLTLERLLEIVNGNLSSIYISGGMLSVDSFSLTVKLIIIISGIGIFLISLDHYKDEDSVTEYEYTQLILLAILGMLLLVSSRDLIMFYLSIELMSLSLYILAGIRRIGQYSTEAGLKYILLGGLSSGLLLFGCGLIYTLTGLTGFSELSAYIWYSNINEGIVAGGLFIIIAILFKLAAAPFHMWAPDVYEGSPTIVTAFFAIVPKIATICILITILFGPFIGLFNEIQPVILISAILSLAIASLAGLNQTKIKRLIAYSAIGHMGFMLIGIAPGTIFGLQATFVYIIIYIIMSFNTFAFILTLYKNGINNYLVELSGISRTQPILAITFALGLLSLAGIPPLAGFFSKYLVLLSAIESQYYIVTIFAVLCSVISSFYYVRIIKWMYFGGTSGYIHKNLVDIAGKSRLSTPALIPSLVLGISFFLILTILFYPNTLLIITFDSLYNSMV